MRAWIVLVVVLLLGVIWLVLRGVIAAPYSPLQAPEASECAIRESAAVGAPLTPSPLETASRQPTPEPAGHASGVAKSASVKSGRREAPPEPKEKSFEAICEGATVDDLGARVAGVAVVFTVYVFPDGFDPRKDGKQWSVGYSAEGVSDHEGRFLLKVSRAAPPGAELRGVVCRIEERYRTGAFTPLSELHECTVVIPRSASVSGVVVDRDGHPLPDQRVEFHASPRGLLRYATTDFMGEFRVDDLPPRAVGIYVSSDTHYTKDYPSVELTLLPGELRVLDAITALPLTRGFLELEFVGEGPGSDGRSARASIQVEFFAGGELVYTGYAYGNSNGGRFELAVRLQGLPAGNYLVRARAMPDWSYAPTKDMTDEHQVRIMAEAENDLGLFRLRAAN